MDKYIEKTDFIYSTTVYQKINNCDNALEILNKATELMISFENNLSLFKDNSEVSKINKYAGKNFVGVSQDTLNIIEKAISVSENTEGLFDITIAPLVKKWAINSDNPNILSNDEIEDILKLVNYKDISINKEYGSVMLEKDFQMIDLGGIAKGYITDKIIDFYKKNGVKNAMLSLGGNIKVLGKTVDNEEWKIAIQDPIKNGTNHPCYFTVSDKSIVTSGGYERAFVYNNELYHHILNPKTGLPAKTDLISVTIINESSFVCDSISTPIFIMGKEKAIEYLKENNIDALLITSNNEMFISKNLLKDFHLLKPYKVFAF